MSCNYKEELNVIHSIESYQILKHIYILKSTIIIRLKNFIYMWENHPTGVIKAEANNLLKYLYDF